MRDAWYIVRCMLRLGDTICWGETLLHWQHEASRPPNTASRNNTTPSASGHDRELCCSLHQVAWGRKEGVLPQSLTAKVRHK